MAAAIFVDLITPPSSPVRASSGAGASAAPTGGCIDLCTPPASPRAPLAPVSKAKPDANDVASAKALGKRKAEPADANAHKTAKEEARPLAPQVSPMEEADEEVLETSAPPAPIQNDVEKGDDDDEDVQCTGRSGANALSDFPHARENCVAVKFVQGQEDKCCSNCYCYVCDAPAKGCPKWSEHCKASHRSAAWQQRRAQWKAQQIAPAAAQPRAAAPPVGSSSWRRHSDGDSGDDSDDDPYDRFLGGLGRPANIQGEARWSCEQMLKAVEQIYPEEHGEPKGFAAGMTLRPYQRQSLAFMINVERSHDAALKGRQTHFGKHPLMHRSGDVDGTSVRGGWLVDEARAAAPLASPCSPSHTCTSRDAPSPPLTAWQMGMGKTAVCTALALATRGQGRTIVICNNTLVGQWIDELKKFGPDLKVCKFYGAPPLREKKSPAGGSGYFMRHHTHLRPPHHIRPHHSSPPSPPRSPSPHHRTPPPRTPPSPGGTHGASWKTADVVVTTPATKLPPQEVDGSNALRCHRLILDESHLYERGADPKLPTTRMFDAGMDHYSPDVVWCVTGTPFSHSLEQLETQARLVGQWKHGLNLSDLLRKCKQAQSGEQIGWDHINNTPRLTITNQQVADKLKQVMIRHSKSQRIQGAEALSLPDAEVATVWLTMSEDERLLYDLASCADGAPPAGQDHPTTVATTRPPLLHHPLNPPHHLRRPPRPPPSPHHRLHLAPPPAGIPKWADVNRVTEATLADLSKGLTKRRAALAQAFISKDELCNMSNRGISAAARAAYARLYGADTSHAATKGSRWEHRTKFHALKADLSALCAAQALGQPFAATS